MGAIVRPGSNHPRSKAVLLGFKFQKALIQTQNRDPRTGETLRYTFPGYMFTAYGAPFAVYQNPVNNFWCARL